MACLWSHLTGKLDGSCRLAPKTDRGPIASGTPVRGLATDADTAEARTRYFGPCLVPYENHERKGNLPMRFSHATFQETRLSAAQAPHQASSSARLQGRRNLL